MFDVQALPTLQLWHSLVIVAAIESLSTIEFIYAVSSLIYRYTYLPLLIENTFISPEELACLPKLFVLQSKGKFCEIDYITQL